MNEMSWVGSQEQFIDQLDVQMMEPNLVIGRFGGNSAEGAIKNEDGCLVWTNTEEDWEFALILDAHFSAQSAELVVSTFAKERDRISALLKLDTTQAFDGIEDLILTRFKSPEFKEACLNIKGETACLFVSRKDDYLYWFSVGDCLFLLNHPELATFGEYQQNHRSFYEWVGHESTFNKAVPCYSSGRRELRKGTTHLFLTTDGLVECPKTKFANASELFRVFDGTSNLEGVKTLLEIIKRKKVRDSTTLISWVVTTAHEPTMPSDLK